MTSLPLSNRSKVSSRFPSELETIIGTIGSSLGLFSGRVTQMYEVGSSCVSKLFSWIILLGPHDVEFLLPGYICGAACSRQ